MAACVPSCLELLLVTIFSKVRNTTMAEYSTKAMWKYHAGGTSVKVDSSEQAAAADVDMKDADATDAPAATGEATETKPAADKDEKPTAAKEDKSAAKDKAAEKSESSKEGKEKEKEKEKVVVDEELLRAFRYFDKTGGPAMLHCS